MPIYEVKIWVSESRYYTVEADDEDEAYNKVRTMEPHFFKTHDQEYEIEARQG